MGTNFTVVQKDHEQLIRVGGDHRNTLPCRFYTREGVRIVSMRHLQAIMTEKYRDSIIAINNSECLTNAIDLNVDGTASTTTASTECTTTTGPTPLELHIYAVPAGRVFMFAPSHIGEIFTISHIVLPKPPSSSNGTTTATKTAKQETDEEEENLRITQNISVISLEVLNVVPPIFDIHHFFSIDESEQLITKALAEQSETYRFHRSTTGTTTSNVHSQRTSEVTSNASE